MVEGFIKVFGKYINEGITMLTEGTAAVIENV
jgi:hypothetical protein